MKMLTVLLLVVSLFRVDVVYAGIPEWEFQDFNGVLECDSKDHSFHFTIDHDTQQEGWWITGTPAEVVKAANKESEIPEKKKVGVVFRTDLYKPENLYLIAGSLVQKRTKIALIQPLISSGKSLGIMKSPESIQTLAGQLKHLGYDVHMFQLSAGGELLAAVKEFRPDFAGISTMTSNYLEGRRIAEDLKKISPDLPIILGGWHASGCVKAYLTEQEKESLTELLNASSPFDFVIAGEGEEILPELLLSLEKKDTVKAISGVSFFRNGEMHVDGSSGRIKKLDELASPSWEGLEVDRYRDKRSGDLDFSVHFNRGCRFGCGFCATPVVYGKGIRTTSAPKSIEYIKSLLEAYSPQVITFTDEDFFANMKWVEQVVDLLEKENLHGKFGVVFDTFASINDLHFLQKTGQGEFLDQMKAVGFNHFTIGIESFNPDVLIKYNKERMILPTMAREERESYLQADEEKRKEMLLKHYLLRTQEAVNFANKHGILVVGDYMLGNIGESEAEVRAGFEIFKNIQNLLVAYIPVFTPFPGTAVWQEAYHSGLLARTVDGQIDWERFNASAGALNLNYDIGKLRDELEVEFYTSPRYTRDMMAAIKRNPELKKLFVDRFNYLEKMFPGSQRVKSQLSVLT